MKKLAILIVLTALVSFGKLPESEFPVDSRLRVRVDFWKRVYTQINSDEAFVHDADDLKVIYGKINYARKGRRAKRRFVRAEKKRVKAILRSIIRKGRGNLTPKEEAVLKKAGDPGLGRLRQMALNIRT